MPSGLTAGVVVLSGAGRTVLGLGEGREGEKRRGREKREKGEKT